MRRLLSDQHHADLLYSIQRLFGRLGWEVYVPLGLEWFDAGYWRFGHKHFGRQLADQYLNPDARWREVEPGLYVTYDPAHPETPIHGVTLETASLMTWDAVLASVQDNQEGFAGFAAETGAEYLYHIGNARQQVDWDLDPLALIAAEAPAAGRAVIIGEEFDSDTTFRYRPPVRADRIASFVNLLPRITEVAPTWDEARTLLPAFTFRSYGHDCPDGILQPVGAIAAEMARSGWGWHDKPTGDGFGHILHNWAAIGRPLIGHAHFYDGQRGAALWEDGVTCVDLSVRSLPEAMAMVAEISADPERHRAMCRAIRVRFDNMYDWRRDAVLVASAIDGWQE
jgi:hypothetical protein